MLLVFSIARYPNRGQVSSSPPSSCLILPCQPICTSLKRWCNVQPENIVEEIARFENMILAEGARLKEQGEKGLEILPGVPTLLDSVCVMWLKVK
jgi:hypothetical protein